MLTTFMVVLLLYLVDDGGKYKARKQGLAWMTHQVDQAEHVGKAPDPHALTIDNLYS